MLRRALPVQQRGVTVLELLLVLGLISIVAGVGYPVLFNQAQKRSVTAAVWSVATNLEEARSRGLMGMTNAGATFTAASNTYDAAGDRFVFEQGFVCENSANVSFSGLGTTSANVSIRIKQPGTGRTGTISVATQGYITWTTAP